jgi:hypothetical protein
MKRNYFLTRVAMPVLLALAIIVFNRCDRIGSYKTGTKRTHVDHDTGTFSDIYQNVLQGACGDCHSPSGSAWGDDKVALDFSSQAQAYQTLLSNTVSGRSRAQDCAGVKEIDPGHPETSYFAAVLIASYSQSAFAGVAACEPYKIHLNDQSIADEEKNSITVWIQNGALNN